MKSLDECTSIAQNNLTGEGQNSGVKITTLDLDPQKNAHKNRKEMATANWLPPWGYPTSLHT